MISQREREICRRKVTYNNKVLAETKAYALSKKFGPQGPYKCPVCGKYHLSRACKLEPSHIKFPASWK